MVAKYEVQIKCDWCAGLIDDGCEVSCSKCYADLEEERDSLKQRVEDLKEEVADLREVTKGE